MHWPMLLAQIDNSDGFLCAAMTGVAGFCRPDSSGMAIPRDMVEPLVEHMRQGRVFTEDLARV